MATANQLAKRHGLHKFLLLCGIAAGLVWIATDIAASSLYPGYSYLSQATSELFAQGAPTSGLVVTMFTIFDILLIAFALQVWRSSKTLVGRSRLALRMAAAMLIGEAVCGLALWPFFPMHMRGAQFTFTDTMHLTITAVSVPLGLLAIGFGAFALGKGFRYFSLAAIVGLVIPGIMGMSLAQQVAANQPTPLLGLYERIAQYVNAVWYMVFAAVLLHTESHAARFPRQSQNLRPPQGN